MDRRSKHIPTFELIGEQFATKLVGEVYLKGKKHGTRIYHVLGHKNGGPGEPCAKERLTDDTEVLPSPTASRSPR